MRGEAREDCSLLVRHLLCFSHAGGPQQHGVLAVRALPGVHHVRRVRRMRLRRRLQPPDRRCDTAAPRWVETLPPLVFRLLTGFEVATRAEPPPPPPPLPPPSPPMLLPPSAGALDIAWQSTFKGAHLLVTAGTLLNFTWHAYDASVAHSLLMCPQEAFDACATDACEVLVPAQASSDFLFHTHTVGGQPGTGAPLSHHPRRWWLTPPDWALAPVLPPGGRGAFGVAMGGD